MSYVGAAAEPLGGVADSLGRLGDEARLRRARIAALLHEAGETASTVVTLAHLEQWAQTSATDARQAAEIAAADATACQPSAPAQTGLRASMGLVDDVAFELLFVNDLSRLVFGRDINTGTAVGPGGRAVSALALIPFGKIAKLGKIAGAVSSPSHVTRVASAAHHLDGVAVAPRAVSVTDDVIAETVHRTGNFTSQHALNSDEALDLGLEFLGDGYRELGTSGSGVFRSQDGLRQFRIDASSLAGSHQPWEPHVHLQVFPSSTARREIVNNHIPLRE